MRQKRRNRHFFLQKPLVTRSIRRDEHHTVGKKRGKHHVLGLLLRACEAECKAARAKLLQNAVAVALQNRKHGFRVLRAKRRQNLGQNTARGNRRRAETDGALVLRPRAHQLLLQIEHMHGVVVELAAARGDGKALRRAQKERLVELVFQLPDMGADGGLRGIELRGGLCEAAAVGYGHKRAQLLKVHGEPPL